MVKQIIKRIVISLFLSIIFLVIGYLLAIPISNYSHASMNDVMFLEGIATTVITLFCTIQGNPSGISLQGLGQKASQYFAYRTLETAKTERESTNYYKNFKNHSVVKLTLNSLTLVFGGVLMILCSIFLV